MRKAAKTKKTKLIADPYAKNFHGMQPVKAEDLFEMFEGPSSEVLPSWLISQDDPSARLYHEELLALPVGETTDLDSEWVAFQRTTQPAAAKLPRGKKGRKEKKQRIVK